MSDVPAPALVPSEAQAAMIAKICACLPLPPLAMRVKKDAKDVSYQSQSGSTANSHDVIAQLMLQAVMVGSKEQNTRRQQIQQDVISALTKDLRLVDAEQAYPVFARYTMRYIQSFVVCGERTAAEMDRLAPKADFLDAEVVERDDPVHIACCHWTASQDAFYKDVYGPGEGLDRFIEDPEALAAFEAIRPDPRKMPPAEIMLRAAEAYCESTSYPALISRAHDRILREAERVEKNRKEAGLDCKNLAEDICNEDTETNSDPPKGDEQETDEMKEKFAGSKSSAVAEVSKLLNSASLSASELEACPAEVGGGSDQCEQTAASEQRETSAPSNAEAEGTLCEEPVVL